MKGENEVKEIREAIFVARDIADNKAYLTYLEGVIDALNHILVD